MVALKSPFRVLAVALFLGWATDLLFYRHSLGLSVLLFVLMLITSLVALSRLEGVSLARRNLWLMEPLLFFAGMVFVRANESLTAMNMWAVIVLLGLLLFFFAADHVERLGMLGYPVVIAVAAWRSLVEPVPPVTRLAETAGQHRERVGKIVPLLRGALIALPLLIIFTLLLASADIFFANYVNSIMEMKFLSDLPDLLFQLAIILTAAWVCAGAMYFALSRSRGAENTGEIYELPGVVHLNRRVGFLEGATVLALINALFAVFAWTQFVYLFSGQAERTMGYEGYREYVRQGFGQLLFVAVLAMAVILGLRWAARPDPGRETRIFNVLSSAMIGLTLVMLVSAFWRMLVWENIEFYINTPLRIYVRVFILFLGLTFGWLFFTMWFKRERFAIGAFVAVLGFLMTVNIMNPDADVASYNLAHRGDELATRYLYLLSDDAVPVLIQGLQSDDPKQANFRAAIRADLQDRLVRLETDTSWRDWQSFHFAKWQAYDLLMDLRKTGNLQDLSGR